VNTTVFVTNKSSAHDYNSALSFGALTFVTSGNYPIFKTTRLQEEIIEKLAYSKPDDFLLLSGASGIAAIAMAVWLEMHGTANLLLWDRSRNEYSKRVVLKSDIRLEIERVRDRLQQNART